MPSSNMYDSMLEQLLGTGAFGSGNQAVARRMASEGSDARLRGELGSSRKKRKGESIPQGAYALAKYPELWKAVEWARTGNLPGGAGSSEKMWLKEAKDSELRDKNAQQRREWAGMQARLLGGRY